MNEESCSSIFFGLLLIPSISRNFSNNWLKMHVHVLSKDFFRRGLKNSGQITMIHRPISLNLFFTAVLFWWPFWPCLFHNSKKIWSKIISMSLSNKHLLSLKKSPNPDQNIQKKHTCVCLIIIKITYYYFFSFFLLSWISFCKLSFCPWEGINSLSKNEERGVRFEKKEDRESVEIPRKELRLWQNSQIQVYVTNKFKSAKYACCFFFFFFFFFFECVFKRGSEVEEENKERWIRFNPKP